MMIVSARKLQAAMLERAIGVTELAKLSGVQSSLISRFMRSDRQARVSTIVKLAQALKVEPLSLIN